MNGRLSMLSLSDINEALISRLRMLRICMNHRLLYFTPHFLSFSVCAEIEFE